MHTWHKVSNVLQTHGRNVLVNSSTVKYVTKIVYIFQVLPVLFSTCRWKNDVSSTCSCWNIDQNSFIMCCRRQYMYVLAKIYDIMTWCHDWRDIMTWHHYATSWRDVVVTMQKSFDFESTTRWSQESSCPCQWLLKVWNIQFIKQCLWNVH